MRKTISRLVHSAKPPLCHDVAEWAQDRGLDALELHPAIPRPTRFPEEFPEGPAFREAFKYQFAGEVLRPLQLVNLTGARVRGVNGNVILEDGSFCVEGQVVDRFVTDHPDYTTRMPKSCREMSGTVYNLLGLWSDHYFHWFHDVLPRLLLALPHLPGDTRYLIQKNPKPFQVESLEALGIFTDRLVGHDPNEDLVPQHLWFATPLGTTMFTDPAVLIELQSRLLDHHRRHFKPGRAGNPVFISRAKTARRRVLNEAEICDRLQQLGVRVVRTEELSFAEQVELFSNAPLVVAPHGAGLTNLLFVNRGARVIELQDERDPRFCYWRLARDMGLKYSAVFGPSNGGPLQDADFSLPLEALEKALAGI